MRRSGAGLHTLVGAYVMDAVPEADRIAFERHLVGCEPCREEVRGLREATARLATAAAIVPRPELREQTLRAATSIRQLPPLIAGQQAPGLGGRVSRWTGRSSLAGTFRQSWLARIAVAAAAVFAVAAVGLGVQMSTTQHRLSAAEQRMHEVAALLVAPDATKLTADVRTGGTATVVMSHRARALVFMADQLPELPPSKAYELWVMGSSGDRPAGMLPAEHGGMSGPMIVRGLAPGDELGLTVEPAAGSRQPTSDPVVLMGLGS
jgi:Anti-sigma-K factor rskA/Putative zinc-finger